MSPKGRTHNRHIANLIYNGADCVDMWVNGCAVRRNGVTQTLNESNIIRELDEAVNIYYDGVE
jgi:hypothetical protein